MPQIIYNAKNTFQYVTESEEIGKSLSILSAVTIALVQ